MTTLAEQLGMSESEFRDSITELCVRGLLTCTRGNPGDQDATYALAWLPLDDPENYPADVRQKHAENMRQLDGGNQ